MDDGRRDRGAAATCAALAMALAANTVLGPLLADVIRYRFSPTLLHQLMAIDLVALAVAAPLALAAAALLRRGRAGGAVLGAAVGAFTVYMTTQTIVGSDLDIAGNGERWFPWHLGLFVLGGATLVGSWSAWARAVQPPWTRRRVRWTAVALFGVAAFLVLGQWGPVLADIVRDRPANPEYLDNPAITWVVALLDLGVLVPLAVASATGLLRGSRWARRTTPVVATFLALTGVTVAGMAVIMLASGDETAEAAGAVVLAVVSGLLLAVGVTVLLPALRIPPAADSSPGHATTTVGGATDGRSTRALPGPTVQPEGPGRHSAARVAIPSVVSESGVARQEDR